MDQLRLKGYPGIQFRLPCTPGQFPMGAKLSGYHFDITTVHICLEYVNEIS